MRLDGKRQLIGSRQAEQLIHAGGASSGGVIEHQGKRVPCVLAQQGSTWRATEAWLWRKMSQRPEVGLGAHRPPLGYAVMGMVRQ